MSGPAQRADGSEAIVLRGRWFEGRDAQRTGRVRLEMRRAGSHHARGWYTYGESDDSPHFDFVLQECNSSHQR